MPPHYTKFSAPLACFALLGGLVSANASAQTVIAQQGANPIVVNQTRVTDNLQVLMAAAAERPNTTSVLNYGAPKHFWVTGLNSASQYLRWTLQVPQASTYKVAALMQSPAANQSYTLQVDDGTPKAFTVAAAGWRKVDAGTVFLPAGTHTLTFARGANPAGSASVKSLELLRDSEAVAYNSRVAAFRAATPAMSTQKYGLMFQYGAWGFPQSGSKKTLDQQAADFNVPAFVNMVQSTGANYVIWSLSWWTYQFDMPNSAVSGIVGNSSRTSRRDLVGEIATALANVGIDFYLYYHTGQDSHLGYNSTDWWSRQNFPADFTASGLGDRNTFFTNWKAVVSEVGTRLGGRLKGWFFDDGVVYYPAAFEELGTAARSGNPQRALSYNSWISPSYTDFQNLSMGEVCNSGYAPVGGNGVYQSGPEAGLYGHCMVMMENDWGIHAKNQVIGQTANTVTSVYSTVMNNSARRVPTSFNMMMYEDGSVSSASLNVLKGLKARLGSGFQSRQINDNSSTITYTGSWGYYPRRNAGDLNDDVHYTSTNGASASFGFTGTAVALLMPTSNAQGNMEVFLDGAGQGLVSTYSTRYTPKVTVFSRSGLTAGAHTVTVVKRSGTFMQLDGITWDVVLNTINDNAANISKSGNWLRAGNRGAGDYNNDVSYTTVDGDAFALSFDGVGVGVLMPTFNDQGAAVEFLVDGVSKGTFATTSNTYMPRQEVFSISGLTPGRHTITGIKRGGKYMQLDALQIVPNPGSQ